MKKYILSPLLILISFIVLGQNDLKNKPIVEFIQSPKILYRGIHNKLRIHVLECDSIKLYDTDNNLIPFDKYGYYRIECTRIRSKTNTYIVKSYSNGINIKSDSINFKIKDIPRPRLRIKDNSGKNLKMTLEELKDAKLEVYITDFLFNDNINVSRYKIKIGSKRVIDVEGSTISEKIYSKIKKLKIGEEILIFDVQCHSSAFHCQRPPFPMLIELIKEH